MAVIVVGVTIWNLPPLRGPIVVVDATYGGNCRAQVLSPPHINNFRPGNAELAVKKACRSGDQCTFLVDVTTLGDPVNGCAKDFTVAYRCENEGASVVREATLPGEANGKAISLDCRQPHPSDRDVQQ